MEYGVIGFVALLASGLTLFSGFGLGTILLPVFAAFFSLTVAIALTAVVHFLNNFFKLVLLGRNANKDAVLRFGLPAIPAAFGGANVLIWLEHLDPLAAYELLGKILYVTPIKLTVAVLMVVFALEALPRLENMAFDKRYLPLGGLLSGFFGGLSGHQGALRSAFLIRCGLSKEGFIATGVVIACLVDLTRIFVYSTHFLFIEFYKHAAILTTAVLAAFAGAWIGSRLVKKVTLRLVQGIVSVMLFTMAVLIGMGVI